MDLIKELPKAVQLGDKPLKSGKENRGPVMYVRSYFELMLEALLILLNLVNLLFKNTACLNFLAF